MPDYHAFGSRFRSPVDFAPLVEADGPGEPSWTLARVDELPDDASLELVGTDRVTAGVEVRLHRSDSGLRLTYDDTGSFLVGADGSRIDWCPGPDPDPHKVRADVLGRVLAAAMHRTGRLCLHGSAVSLPAGALGFIAPKLHGKSTLAAAALAHGARLLTDDSLPLELGEPVMAWPGVHGLRVWEDTRRHLGGEADASDDPAEKVELTRLAAASVERAARPLLALYVLAPVAPAPGVPAVSRRRLPEVHAALSVVRLAKIGALLGGPEAPVLLERATRVARSVPVYALGVVRDFGALDTVVDQLLEWHAAPADPPSRPRP